MAVTATSPLMPTYAEPRVTFARGLGTELWDVDGKRYLDFLCGLAVTSLGHAHPAVAEAIALQASTLLHVSNLFGNQLGPQVASTLDRLLGGGGQLFLCNSGAEANECAIKLARRWGGRGRHGLVSAYGSFHGRTLATLTATGQPTKHEPFQPLPEGFRYVAWNDAADLAHQLDPTVVSAVMLEPLQGEGGVQIADPEFLREARRLCDELGALLIMDEIQTGLGRTGRWWGFEHADIRPDVVTIAKSLGSGMPIGACWARADVAAAFRPGDHGSTFGGQPLACSAAIATLRVMEEEDVPVRAERAGARLRAALDDVPGIVGTRGLGLLLAAELDPAVLSGFEGAAGVQAALLDRGLVTNAVTPTSLRLAPPLLVSDAEIDEAVAILRDVIAR
ncbi:MAG: aspartate aminotransferase family protein [Acidimicrobiales bacterium]